MGGSFKNLFATIEESLSYKKEKAKIDLTIELQDLMKKNNMTRTDLARGLNKSNAYVTQMLRGERNFTIDTMVEIAEALGSNLAIHFSLKEEKKPHRDTGAAKKIRIDNLHTPVCEIPGRRDKA